MTPDEVIKTALEPITGLNGKVFPLEGLEERHSALCVLFADGGG